MVQNVWSSQGPATLAMTSLGVGALGGAGFMLGSMGDTWSPFGYFLLAKAIFHIWEFLYVALFHPNELNADCIRISVNFFSSIPS